MAKRKKETKREVVKGGILAEGEVTGHAHRLGDEVTVFKDGDNLRTFDLKKETPLKHEEHGEVVIGPGKWASGQAQEYDYFEEQVRKIAD